MMSRPIFPKGSIGVRNLWSICALTVLAFAPSARADFDSEAGGVQISLGSGWEALKHTPNFFVQERARYGARGTILNVGAFKVDLSLEQYAAIAVGSLTSGSESQLGYVARQLGMSREDLDSLLTSPAGKQVADQVRQASRTMRFELVSLTKEKIGGAEVFEIHARVTMLDSNQTLYSRQFLMKSTAPKEVVQISYIGPAKGLFSQKDLADAIHPPRTK
jgi:hypothetical protein